jgi:hypothetical protein
VKADARGRARTRGKVLALLHFAAVSGHAVHAGGESVDRQQIIGCNMSKYDAIRDLLRTKSGIVDVSMDDLSARIPGGLPESAYTWELWWSNGDDTHTQSKSWAAAGYKARPDLARRTVRFTPC